MEKTAFVSFRCPDDLAVALGAYLARHEVSRSAFIVGVLREALGVDAPEPVGTAAVAYQLQELRAAMAELTDRFSAYGALEKRLRSLEEYVGMHPGDASWLGDEDEQERERREQEDERRQQADRARKRKAAKDAAMVSSREAYGLLAEKHGWDPKDLKAKHKMPDGTEMSYNKFWNAHRAEHFRRLGFEPKFSLRDANIPGSRWLTPDPAVYSHLLQHRPGRQ